MDRLAPWALALVAAALIALPSVAGSAERTAGRHTAGRQPESAGKRIDYSLGEIRILGSPEQPHVLFFLPRAKFRLLPLEDDERSAQSILIDDKVTGETADPARMRIENGDPGTNR